MTTTCADVVTRALGLSVANQGVLDVTQAADVALALAQINAAQHRAYTLFTAKNKTGELYAVTQTTTAGASDRRLVVASNTPRVQRILRITLADGTECALVDPNVPTSELAPRYYTFGETIAEVSNDWDTTSAGTVQLSLLYSIRPTDFDLSGALTQAISIPDRFTDILVYDLGAWLCERDVGRTEEEVTDLQTKRDATLSSWIESAAQFGGVAVYSFNVPSPSSQNKD